MIPAGSDAAYDAARRGAARVDRSDRGRLVVSGPERASYLQGLLTNDVVALTAGQGCYAAYLTAQGRMIADLHVYELGDVTETFAQVAVIGPGAAPALSAALGGVGAEVLAALPEHGNLRAEWAGGTAIVTRVTDTGEPGYDVFVDRAQAAALAAALGAGVVDIGEATAEAIRIEAGVPAFHRDMDEETIPLEANIESRAISFSKGCYVGQEVVIRVLHRGHGRVARKLVGLLIDGAQVPPPGTMIRSGDREIGRVTSSTRSPALQRPIALGYVHRDFLEPGTKVTIEDAEAEVTTLPFVDRPPRSA